MSTKSRKRKQRIRFYKTGNYKYGYPPFTPRKFKVCLVKKYESIRNKYLKILMRNVFVEIIRYKPTTIGYINC